MGFEDRKEGENTFCLEERLVRSALPIFLAFVLFSTIAGIWSGYFSHNAWTIGDWLINYQGGMVRRGLIGEVIFQMSLFSSINPGVFAALFQSLFYFGFFLFSYLTLKKQERLLPYSLLLFSPFIFTFQLNDLQGGFRKEVIYFFVLSFLVWCSYLKSKEIFKIVFFIFLTCYVLLVLSHEMTALFLPYVLMVYFYIAGVTKRNILIISIPLFLIFSSFFATFLFQGTFYHASNIFHSLASQGYILRGGAIASLDKGQFDPLGSVIYCLKNENYIFYFFTLILSMLAFLPLIGRVKLIFCSKFLIFLFVSSLILSIPLFLFAIDWGRFIYIHLVSWFFLFLLPVKSNESTNYKYYLSSIHPGFRVLNVAFFLVFSLAWHIPHFATPIAYAKNFKETNLFSYVRPWERLSHQLEHF